MGMGRLTDSARGRELSNAVFPIGLLSGEAQGDGITKNVADLGLLLKQTKPWGQHKCVVSFSAFLNAGRFAADC